MADQKVAVHCYCHRDAAVEEKAPVDEYHSDGADGGKVQALEGGGVEEGGQDAVEAASSAVRHHQDVDWGTVSPCQQHHQHKVQARRGGADQAADRPELGRYPFVHLVGGEQLYEARGGFHLREHYRRLGIADATKEQKG